MRRECQRRGAVGAREAKAFRREPIECRRQAGRTAERADPIDSQGVDRDQQNVAAAAGSRLQRSLWTSGKKPDCDRGGNQQCQNRGDSRYSFLHSVFAIIDVMDRVGGRGCSPSSRWNTIALIMSRGRFCTVAVTLLLTIAWSIRARSQPSQPTQHTTTPTFVGAQACAACHQQIHADWKGARHSKMIQPATAASVVGDFSKDSVTLKGKRYRLRVANGEYFISESYLTGKEQEHRVELTLGSRRIQHYLTTIERGSIIVLPPSWDVQRGEWFDNMDIVRPDENDQKPVQQWNKNCVGCHVSQQDNNYRAADRTYKTEWTDFGTSCERCHGPGSAHVQAYARGASGRAAGEHTIVRPTRLDPATSSMICAQCHSLRDIVAPGYTAGANYYDFFQPVLEYGSAQGTGSDLLGRRPPAPFLERCVGPLAERVLSARRRDLHELPSRSAHPQYREERTAGAGEQCPVHQLSPGARRPADRSHAAQGRQRRQFLRRMSHAEDRRQHQGDDARSHDRRAGAGKHRRLRDPQRVHRVPYRQAGGVGGQHARTMVAARPSRETDRPGRSVHRRAREPPRGAGSPEGDRGR